MRFVFRKVGLLVLTILLTSLIVFAITQLLPGDIARVILGREAGEAAITELRVELGLNEPILVQYGRWLVNFVQGDWGQSFSTHADVFTLVIERLRNSLMLAAVILVISIPIAVALGVIAGLHEEKSVDHVISVGSLSFVGLPEFITGLLLIEIFAFRLGLLPANSTIRVDAGFLEALPMLILPAATAALVLLAYVARLTRTGVIEELKKPYVRTAKLKGLPKYTVTYRHVLRNALIPTITVIAISFGWMLSGLIVIENVYNYPGLGRLLVFAIERRDIPLVQAITLITVFVFLLANLAADLIHIRLNPRINITN